MKAVGYRKNLPIADDEALLDLELATPIPGPRDLLVRMKAVSVNPVDVKLRAQAAPPASTARILGFDGAGVIEAVGAEVTLFRPGEAVFYAGSILRPGTNAEFHLVDERIVGHKPKTLSFAEAAALPLTGITAWELLFDRLGVHPGKQPDAGCLLIIGAAGGVGSMLIQLARRLTGLTVIATASRPETAAWCSALGAHQVIDHRKPLAEELRRIGHPQVGRVASLTATEHHFPAIVEILEPQGRLGVIDDPPTLDINSLKRKSLSFHWEFMFTRSLFETEDMIGQHRLLDEVAALIDAGVIRTTLNANLGPVDAANLKKAHALIESGKSRGKIVLEGF
jgi:zinc-binding alcohol dehydrogenase family protein